VRINGDWEAYWRNLARKAAANDNASHRPGRRIA